MDDSIIQRLPVVESGINDTNHRYMNIDTTDSELELESGLESYQQHNTTHQKSKWY